MKFDLSKKILMLGTALFISLGINCNIFASNTVKMGDYDVVYTNESIEDVHFVGTLDNSGNPCEAEFYGEFHCGEVQPYGISVKGKNDEITIDNVVSAISEGLYSWTGATYTVEGDKYKEVVPANTIVDIYEKRDGEKCNFEVYKSGEKLATGWFKKYWGVAFYKGIFNDSIEFIH